MFLEESDFKQVVLGSPLFSLDLVVIKNRQVLLGQRRNRPAKDYWFVPGGRVRKNEPLKAAFDRMCRTELGIQLTFSDVVPLGVFEHFYKDSVFGNDVSTHYIAYGLRVDRDLAPELLPDDQHSDYRWWGLSEALSSEEVHHFTKLYLADIDYKG